MPTDSTISGYTPWTVTVLLEFAALDEGQQYKDMMVKVQLIHLLEMQLFINDNLNRALS